MRSKTLTPELLNKIDAYWRAANYLSVGQIYLYDNPLLKRPLALEDFGQEAHLCKGLDFARPERISFCAFMGRSS